MLDTIFWELKEGHIISHFPNQLLFFPWQRFPSLQLQWQLRMTGSCCCPSDKRPQRSKKLMTRKIVQRPTAKSPGNWVFRTRRPCHKCGRFARSILDFNFTKANNTVDWLWGKTRPSARVARFWCNDSMVRWWKVTCQSSMGYWGNVVRVLFYPNLQRILENLLICALNLNQ